MERVLKNGELIIFCQQLAMILRSGISVLEGISIMEEEADTLEGKEILHKVYKGIEESGFLYISMKEVGVFPKYIMQMTEIGELSGRLEEVMTALSRRYEREDAINESIRGAVIYPLVMFGMLTAVVLVLMIKVMPVFEQVMVQMGSEMTGLSAVILQMGKNMSRYSYVLAGMMVAIAVLGIFFWKNAKGKELFRRGLEHFFVTKKLIQASTAARFAGGMSMCLSSGLDTDQSLELSEQLVEHRELKEKINQCRQTITEGQDFGKAIAKTGIFQGIYSQMISIGYRSGSLDEAMSKVADLYEEEVEEKVQGVLSVLEPTIIVILSLIIGSILLSVMLPMLAVMNGIG